MWVAPSRFSGIRSRGGADGNRTKIRPRLTDRSPQSPPVLPRLPFRCPELLHPGRVEWVLDVGVPISLLDDLLVDQQVVALPENERQQPAVSIPAGRASLDFQPDPLAFDQAGREPAGFLAVILNGLSGVLDLGGVYADEPDGLRVSVDLDLDRVAVDDPDDCVVGVLAGCSGRSWSTGPSRVSIKPARTGGREACEPAASAPRR